MSLNDVHIGMLAIVLATIVVHASGLIAFRSSLAKTRRRIYYGSYWLITLAFYVLIQVVF